MHFNLILDASAFEKGLGNISLWPMINHKDLLINAYIPVYTVEELDFQRFRRKSFMAKKALHFVDQLQETDVFKLHLEYPELNEAISWNETLKMADPKPSSQQLIPTRFKKLLKSCFLKCYYEPKMEVEGKEGGWILVTEDEKVRALARQFHIPHISVVEADSALGSFVKSDNYQTNVAFSRNLKENSDRKKVEDGKEVYVTNFDEDFLASRPTGELFVPRHREKSRGTNR